MERKVVLCRCPESKKLIGIRADYYDGSGWRIAWAFPLSEKTAESEGYGDETIQLTYPMEDYPGCPFCKSKFVVVCGNCGKLTCFTGKKSFKCEWCGNTGEIHEVEKLSVSGENM